MMPGCPDYQKSKLYKWEQTHVNPVDTAYVPFDNIQNVVNHIWKEMGLEYPPRVKPMPKQVTKWAGDANRLVIRFPEHGAKTVTIIHELAHSMTADLDGASMQHGPGFVGVYMRLLDKFIPGLNLLVLMHTANEMGVKFNILQTPTILDQE
jgi:hypothetical protein